MIAKATTIASSDSLVEHSVNAGGTTYIGSLVKDVIDGGIGSVSAEATSNLGLAKASATAELKSTGARVTVAGRACCSTRDVGIVGTVSLGNVLDRLTFQNQSRLPKTISWSLQFDLDFHSESDALFAGLFLHYNFAPDPGDFHFDQHYGDVHQRINVSWDLQPGDTKELLFFLELAAFGESDYFFGETGTDLSYASEAIAWVDVPPDVLVKSDSGVIPVGTSEVPETSSGLLTGLGFLVLVFNRRLILSRSRAACDRVPCDVDEGSSRTST